MVFSDGRPAVHGELEPDERAKLGEVREAGARMLGGNGGPSGDGGGAAGSPVEGGLAFELPRHGGGTVSLAGLLAQGPVVVDFWATWCAPCKRALPRYQLLQDRYGAQGVTFVAISEDDPRSQARIGPYLQAQGLTLAVALDGDGRVAKQFGVSDLPTTFVIAPQGRVVAKHVGYSDGDEHELERLIRGQLGLPDEPGQGPAPGGR
jgi:peroxiredoxin